jgi:hypothetical protein
VQVRIAPDGGRPTKPEKDGLRSVVNATNVGKKEGIGAIIAVINVIRTVEASEKNAAR